MASGEGEGAAWTQQPCSSGLGAPRLGTRSPCPRACPGPGAGWYWLWGLPSVPLGCLPAGQGWAGHPWDTIFRPEPSAQSPPRWGRPLHPGHLEEGWKVTPSFRGILYKGADLLPRFWHPLLPWALSTWPRLRLQPHVHWTPLALTDLPWGEASRTFQTGDLKGSSGFGIGTVLGRRTPGGGCQRGGAGSELGSNALLAGPWPWVASL